MRRPDGLWWGRDPLGPAATIVSKERSSAPWRRISVSSSRAKAASVGPSSSIGATAASAASAMPQAASMRATSPSSLTRRSASTRPLDGTRSDAGEPLVRVATLLGPGHVLGLEAQPRRCRRQVARPPPAAAPRSDRSRPRRPRPAAAELAGGLLLVAPVGDEGQRVGPHEQQGGRAREAGEVADVGEVGDEERVAAGRVERAAEPIDPAATSIGGSALMRATSPPPRSPSGSRGHRGRR